MAKIKVGVSGINAVDNPGPGVGVARCLKEDPDLEVEIIGLSYDAMDPGIYLDWVVDRSFMMPYPSGEGHAYFERLAYIKASCGLDLVIPNLDAELPLYIKHQNRIEEMGVRTVLPSMSQFKLRGKDRLAEIAEATDLKLPETRVVTSLELLDKAMDELEFPLWIKGCFYKAHLATTRPAAVAEYHALVAEWGYPIIVQESVSGDELNVVGVGDGRGGHLGLFGIKKMSVTAQGKVWTGVSVKHEKMLDTAARLMEHTKWKGPFELECIVDGEEVYLIEVNPRFPAWVYFGAPCGVNLPAALTRLALGREASGAADYDPGKLFVRYSYELVTDMSRFQQAITRGEIQ